MLGSMCGKESAQQQHKVLLGWVEIQMLLLLLLPPTCSAGS